MQYGITDGLGCLLAKISLPVDKYDMDSRKNPDLLFGKVRERYKEIQRTQNMAGYPVTIDDPNDDRIYFLADIWTPKQKAPIAEGS